MEHKLIKIRTIKYKIKYHTNSYENLYAIHDIKFILNRIKIIVIIFSLDLFIN